MYGSDGFNEDPERLTHALALYEMYARAYPEYQSSYYMLGLAQKANGLTEEAKASFKRALEKL